MTTLPYIYSLVCIFLAAIVRGYSGFGFSLLAITALSLMLKPAEIVPSIFLLEIVASINLLPGIWKDIHWKSILPLTAGCLIATPIGVWLLATIPAPYMQIVLGVFVIAAAILLYQGYSLSRMPGPIASTAAGAASGLANGAFGIGGPPVILFYFASPAGNIAGRASLIAYFLATDTIGLAFLSREDLVTWDAVFRALIFFPALLAGVWVGARSFKGADPVQFRKRVLILLGVLALLTIAQGLRGSAAIQ